MASWWLVLGLPAVLAAAVTAHQTTQCDTSEGERALITRRALEALSEEYDVIPGKLSFPPFAQPAGRYGLVSFNGADVNPPVLCEITGQIDYSFSNVVSGF